MVQSGRQQSDTCTARSRRRFPGRTFYDLDDGEGLRFGPRPLGFAFDRFLAFGTAGWAWGNPSIVLCARRRGAVRQSGRKGYGLDCGCWRRLRHHRKRFCAHRISLHQSCHCGLCERGNQFGRRHPIGCRSTICAPVSRTSSASPSRRIFDRTLGSAGGNTGSDHARHPGARAFFVHGRARSGDQIDVRLGCGIAGQEALEVRGAQHQKLTVTQRHDIRGARQAA